MEGGRRAGRTVDRVDLGNKTWRMLARNKYVLAVLVLGLVLLLLPRPAAKTAAPEYAAPSGGQGDAMEASGIPLDTEGERLRTLLRSIRGVGEAEVLLSRAGAVVVCDGGDDAAVRLAVTQAVSAYTGLGSDRITVMKMK